MEEIYLRPNLANGNHHYRGGNWFFKKDYEKRLGLSS